ncbi:hypothetical protein EV421DRAFT_1806950, partial [Armillaria borealis]
MVCALPSKKSSRTSIACLMLSFSTWISSGSSGRLQLGEDVSDTICLVKKSPPSPCTRSRSFPRHSSQAASRGHSCTSLVMSI